jgi:superfamily II DNA or RNA helicase
MITLSYESPWVVRWTVGDLHEGAWLKRQFTFTDYDDTRHKARFGHFPERVVIDVPGQRMAHGQAIWLADAALRDGKQVQVVDPYPRICLDTGPLPADLLPGVTLRRYQQLAPQAVLLKGHGILKAGTGAGKTVMMGAIVKLLLERTPARLLVMIFSKDLLNQTARRFEAYGVPGEDIGIIHSDIPADEQAEAATKRVILTTHLSITKFQGTIDRTTYVLCDEAHEAMGPLWSHLLSVMPNLLNVIGFTATPWDNDDEEHRMRAIFGRVVVDIPVRYLIDNGWLMDPDTYFLKLVYEDRDKKLVSELGWQQAERQFILEDRNRNLLPILVLRRVGGRMLVLYDKIEHGETLRDLYEAQGVDVRLAEGKTSTKDRESAIKWFEKPLEPGQRCKVLLGSKIFNQGVDLIGGCDILFVVGATKKRRVNVQRIGRALRLNGTGRLLIFDVWDSNHHHLTKWSGARKKVYVDLKLKAPTVVPIAELGELLQALSEKAVVV